ncbi:MAG: amino acid adenylation domain-containing protein, partial [Ruminiclostridium sp.]|nr:amino acid adenylation domain-containing protein [Ruminiclostridium sp.]
GKRETDYGTVGRLMRSTAAWISAKGLKERAFIPVRFDASAEFVAAVCGVWLSGNTAVPMGTSFPDERVRFISENCEAPFVIDDTVIDEIRSTEPLDDSAYPDTDAGETAFLLYTSGSTGMPKGILHTFAGLLANRSIGKPPVYSTGQRWAMGAPMYFVASVAVYKVLTFGGCVHLLDPETMRDVKKLEDYYEEHGITVGFISPSVLSNFNNRASTLKLVMTGSERLTGQCSRDGYKLNNNYGMSETMGTVCSFLVEKPYETTPVGIPPEGSVWALLDDNGEPVRDGEEGEMCVKGTYTTGYFKDPEATEKLFRGGWLHTGDILKKLPDGNLVYINRKDWMVKINGQRVEPGEIENVLLTVPGVDKAVVKAVTGAGKSVMLCAYYTGEALEDSFISEKLGEKLAAYMIPSFYMHLDELPLNANGKVDRKNLPLPDMSSRKTEYVPPENARQRQICNAFGKVLGISEVGINDDFFSLGGDSIKVMALQRTLREAGIELTSNAIFTAHTPKEMSDKVTDPSKLAVYAGKPADSYPLTNSQLSVYLDCRTPGKETSYNNVFGLFLPADMGADAEKLRAAAENILGRYPILSMSVRDVEGVPSLVASGKKTEVKLENTDITDRSALADRLNTEFDLENEPLSRAAVYVEPEGVFLVCVLHHIVSDGTSVSILANNIAAAYNGKAVLPEEMSNLTLAQYEAENAAELSDDAKVYREMLDLIDGDTELYADDDPSLKDKAGKLGVYNTTLSGIQTARLSENNLTEASLFMSAYAYMLRLFCNQKSVLFFTGENGRHDPVLQNTVGMMVHNIPVLSVVDDNADCVTFMSDMQSRFHDLTTHDGADFAGLCGEYGIHPDCFFVYQGTMLSLVDIGGRNIPMEFYRADSVMAAMTLHVLKKNSTEYELHFEYAADKFTEDTVKRMSEVYSRIAAGLCGTEKLGEINLVSDEALMLMDEANSDEADFPVTDIVSLFRAQAAKTPDNTAVIYKDETYTYSQIDDISERIAGKLRSLGIGHGDVVSILIPRCAYMTLASLGALKSGAAYQPLDPSYPTERLTFMMQDADCKLLIADEELLSRVPEYKGKILLTKDIPALPACERIADTPAPDDLFILLYTSGSTGTPKGVMLEHRNIANFCSWYRGFYHLDENSRVAAYASYGFDANMMDQYPALTTGACVCIMEDEIRLDLLAMEAWLNRLGITHSFMTTQVGRQFYTLANAEKLKYLSTGGEKLVPLPPRDAGPEFYNLYGPTECTILTTRKRVDRLYERVPIGRALTNYKCYVIDANGRRMPPLIPGELLIAGRGVARGYLNRPDLTEKAFIRNPFCDNPGFDRAYRSGDIVRLLPNGEIDFIGRNDGQVKVRGFRIELTEVEGVIREFAGISDATVQAFEDESSGEKFIAAYVVSPEPVDISAMNEFIMECKPPYMVPAVTMQIERIPLNQNQKINKKELPKPQRQKVEIIPPQTEVQQKIFDCIAEVIGHKDFGITTNIYEAGLSSIGAIRLNVLLSKAFDTAVSTRDLKENNTIDKLETFLTGADNKLPVFEVQSEYGLTKTQEGIYVESVARPDDTIYNIPILLEISDEIDSAKLKTAIVGAVNAHPILKTRLFLNDDGDVRMRRMDGDFSFDESCVGERDISSIDEEKTKLVKPFKLLGGRLFRVEILHGEKTYLFIEMHHIISDGSSMMIFLNDISEAYAGKTLGKEAYTGYEVVLNEEMLRAGDAYANAKSYYENLLDGAETQSLPAGDIHGEKTPSTASYDLASDKVTPEAAKQWCEKNGASMNGLFSAAFGLTLNKYLGTESAAFAGIYSGRNDSRLAGTMAMLVKTIPIVSSLSAGKTVAQYVREMSEQLVDSQSNDIYSFAEMSRALNVNAEVMFAWQGDEFIFDSLCGLPAKLIPVELSEAKAPINMNVWIVGGKLRFITEYRADRFSEEYIRGFSAALETALDGILRREWLTEISVLSDEARRMLEGFNATDVTVPYTTCNRLFEEQVRRVPDKTA